ncbi:MAG TPA: hypothetical protein VFE01_04315 [Terracidiphilus sp.]|nr:hypothetical protein [Terracidiphilus sp.]
MSIPPIEASAQAVASQAPSSKSLPDAPEPQGPNRKSLVNAKLKTSPCKAIPASVAGGSADAAVAIDIGSSAAGLPAQNRDASSLRAAQSNQPGAPSQLPPCPPPPPVNWFARFLNGPQVKPLTPREKGVLAVRNLLDPFNAVTILGTAAVSVGSDAHSPYGPGMTGFGRYVGVEYAQDMTGEFVGTFLIPSIVHQDPHYHRMPNAPIIQRIRHAIVQVFWTQGDNGRGMLNYANLVGFAADDEISDLYVPARQTDLPASATRYAIGLGIAPTDNFITEFLPDLARRIHIRIVLVQRIIDQVAKTEGSGPSQ